MNKHLNIMACLALCALLIAPCARAAGGADYGRGPETDPVASALFVTVTNDIATVAATKIVVTNSAAVVAADKIIVTNSEAAVLAAKIVVTNNAAAVASGLLTLTNAVGVYTNAMSGWTGVYNAAGCLLSHTP